jgi:ubiquitin carboxyl-terminal hydrolase 1
MHYGYTHSSGHYVCIRRKPRRRKDDEPDEEVFRPTTTRKSCPDGCHCQSCAYFGQVRDVEGEESVPGRGWLRISDADVEEVGEEALIEARGAVFMLFYERVGEYEGESRPALPQGMLGNGEADGPVEDNLVSAKL